MGEAKRRKKLDPTWGKSSNKRKTSKKNESLVIDLSMAKKANNKRTKESIWIEFLDNVRGRFTQKGISMYHQIFRKETIFHSPNPVILHIKEREIEALLLSKKIEGSVVVDIITAQDDRASIEDAQMQELLEYAKYMILDLTVINIDTGEKSIVKDVHPGIGKLFSTSLN